MSKVIASVNVADTFQVWLDKTNLIINAMANEVVTANTNANGSVTVGNAYISGIVYATTLATTGIRGGNVQSVANLAILSNVTVNGFATLTTSLGIGSNLTVNTGTIFIGNSTVNAVTNSSKISIGTGVFTTVNSTTGTITVFNANSIVSNNIVVGNVTITPSTFSLGNSTVNAVINSTSYAVQNSSGTFVVSLGDSVSNTFFNDKFKFSNTGTSGLTTQVIDSYLMSQFRGVEYLFSCKDPTNNNAMVSKILCIHNGVNAFATEYGEIYTDVDLGAFAASTNATHVLMQFTPTAANITITYTRIHLGA